MKNKKKIPKVFFSFLIASFFIWLLINLSKESKSLVNYRIKFINLPKDKVIQQNSSKKINLLLKGSGFKLFNLNFKKKNIKFSVNKLIKKTQNLHYLLTSTQKEFIQKQLGTSLLLEKFLKDTIFIKLTNLITKKVPIKPNFIIDYKLGYSIVDKIEVKPDSVLLYGVDNQLSKINYLYTDKVILHQLSKNYNKYVNLILPKEKIKLNMRVSKVEIKIKVDKFTEGKLEIPIKVINIPKKIKLNIYPKVINLVYKVGLKDFNKVTKNTFEIICDYKKMKKQDLSFFVPELKFKPDYIKSVKIEPQKIDFLIHK